MENYAKKLRELKASLTWKPRVLLHCCCAPCATAAFEELKDAFSVTAYYYNPNITEKIEYEKRFSELARLAKLYGFEGVDEGYAPNDFYDKIKGMEACPERGERCRACISLRLSKTAKRADAEGFDYFATTLTLSPLKDAEFINSAGLKAEQGQKTRYLASDFKKYDGYKKSVELSQKFGLYRQNYCGCEFSKR